MAGANTNIQLTSLDFDALKTNFLNYLQSQSTFQDYNFEGSALNTLVDLLTYNTQYNSYYLNMIANEMFLDSSVQRSSVVSHAKLLSYVPKSAIAPTATVNITFNNVTTSSLTLPAYLNFTSSAINGINYNFVNTDSYTVSVVNGTATFNNVEIKQGVPATVSYTVNSTKNPSYTFQIPDATIDTSTLKVYVQQSASNTAYTVFNPITSYLDLTSTSQVYFTQEALNGNYEVYFGDGTLGQRLVDNNIVILNYLSTEGTSSAGANSFVLMDSVAGFSASSVTSVTPANQGGDKESVDSIKFQAPKAFASQGRAITKNDYITAIQQNKLGYTFDAVNVWGGEENDPPVYGQVFVSLKPTGIYNLTTTQKKEIVDRIIKPISVLTVTPTIVEPDYTYIKLVIDVVYDPTKTNQTVSQMQAGIKNAVLTFASKTLNTFNSTFNGYTLLNYVQSYNQSILNSDYVIKLEKRFSPNLNSITSYNLYYNTPLEPGVLLSGVSSYPPMQFLDPKNPGTIIDGVFLEEEPAQTQGIDTITLINPGFGYQYTPTVTIVGDGQDATAHAIIIDGYIQSIVVDNPGYGYTSAIAVITPQSNDTTGKLGQAVVTLQGRYGTLSTYYLNSNKVKTILNYSAGTIDYTTGVINLANFNPYQIDNDLGVLSVTVNPAKAFISSSYNRIITIDPNDTSAIVVNVTAKT